jgi:hypothetical protein
MQELVIEVNRVEEWQMTGNKHALEKIFAIAKSTIVNGEKVILVRKEKDGKTEAFDEFSTLEDLDTYRIRVFRYL